MRCLARLIAAIAIATAILASGVVVTILGAETVREATVHRGLPDVSLRLLAQRSEILAADGSLLSALYEEDRVPVALLAVPQVLRDANVSTCAVAEGGSTITQQLVKNSILTADRSYDRKAKEAVLAFRMEREVSKHDILES